MSTKLTKIIADFQTQLAAKVSAGATTATLQSATDDDGVSLPSGNYCFTVDKNNSSKEYFVCALSGTALTGVYSVSRQGVQTSGFVREHRVGASIEITDFSSIKYINDLIGGTTDLDATDPLKYDADPTLTDDKHLATKKYVDDIAISGSPKATEAVYGISKLSSAASDPTAPVVLNNEEVSATSGANKVVKANSSGYIDAGFIQLETSNPGLQSSSNKLDVKIKSGGGIIKDSNGLSVNSVQFGGNGSDGALNITSGTTTIDLGAAAFFIKNYTSMNISAGATLNFTNSHTNGTIIILKSQGNVVIAGTLSTSGAGAAGGASVEVAKGPGNIGNNASSYYEISTTPLFAGVAGEGTSGGGGNTTGGLGAGGYGGTGGGTSGSGGKSVANQLIYTIKKGFLFDRYITLISGSGGGSGGVGNTTTTGALAGKGGNGGAALLLECGGSLNFTGTINTSGQDGNNYGTYNGTSGGAAYSASGGGGGSAGTPLVIYNSLTSSSGTLVATGGTGGNGDVSHGGGSAGTGGGGGAGLGGNGSNYSTTTGGAGGATGTPTYILQNTNF